MPKFRLLLDSKKGDHFSNAMGPVECQICAARTEMLTGACPEIIPDTRTLRRELADLDRRAAELVAKSSPPGPGVIPLPMAWRPPLALKSDAFCECAKCQAIRETQKEQAQAKKVLGEAEDPYFAPPELKHGMATIEATEKKPATIPLPSVQQRRQPTLVSRLCDLVRWFVGVEAGL